MGLNLKKKKCSFLYVRVLLYSLPTIFDIYLVVNDGMPCEAVSVLFRVR